MVGRPQIYSSLLVKTAKNIGVTLLSCWKLMSSKCPCFLVDHKHKEGSSLLVVSYQLIRLDDAYILNEDVIRKVLSYGAI